MDMSPLPNEKAVKIEVIAEILGVTTRTINRWAKERDLPAFQPSRTLYFYISEVKKWWEEQRL